MKQWFEGHGGNGEHKLTRKGIDNMLLTLLLTQLSILTGSQPSISEYYFTGTHL